MHCSETVCSAYYALYARRHSKFFYYWQPWHLFSLSCQLGSPIPYNSSCGQALPQAVDNVSSIYSALAYGKRAQPSVVSLELSALLMTWMPARQYPNRREAPPFSILISPTFCHSFRECSFGNISTLSPQQSAKSSCTASHVLATVLSSHARRPCRRFAAGFVDGHPLSW